MSLAALAGWARALTPTDVPEDVLRRAALQHLSTAAAVRRGDAMALAASPYAANADALRLIGRALAGEPFTDTSVAGHSAHGPVLGAWAGAAGATTPAMWTATVVANEIADRLGLVAAIDPDPALARTWLEAAGTAAALAWLRGLGAAELAAAVALAIERSPRLAPEALADPTARRTAVAGAAAAAFEAVEAAADGERAELDMRRWALAPLDAAFDGAGRHWTTRGVTYGLTPAPPWLQAPIQGMQEIGRRHQKAASKRLRADQVVRVEIRLDPVAWRHHRRVRASGALAERLPWSLPEAAGAIVALHPVALGPFEPGEVEAHREAIETVASVVEVVPDWTCALRWTAAGGRRLGGMAREVGWRLRVRAALRAVETLSAAPRPAWGDLAQGLKALPGTAAAALDPERTSLADLPDRGVHLARPTQIRLFTTRGGWWAERREVIEGGPETSLDDLEADVVAKFAADGDTARQATARVFLAGDAPAADAIALLGMP